MYTKLLQKGKKICETKTTMGSNSYNSICYKKVTYDTCNYLKYNLIFNIKQNLKRVETFRKAHTDMNGAFFSVDAEQQYVSIQL